MHTICWLHQRPVLGFVAPFISLSFRHLLATLLCPLICSAPSALVHPPPLFGPSGACSSRAFPLLSPLGLQRLCSRPMDAKFDRLLLGMNCTCPRLDACGSPTLIRTPGPVMDVPSKYHTQHENRLGDAYVRVCVRASCVCVCVKSVYVIEHRLALHTTHLSPIYFVSCLLYIRILRAHAHAHTPRIYAHVTPTSPSPPPPLLSKVGDVSAFIDAGDGSMAFQSRSGSQQ